MDSTYDITPPPTFIEYNLPPSPNSYVPPPVLVFEVDETNTQIPTRQKYILNTQLYLLLVVSLITLLLFIIGLVLLIYNIKGSHFILVCGFGMFLFIVIYIVIYIVFNYLKILRALQT